MIIIIITVLHDQLKLAIECEYLKHSPDYNTIMYQSLFRELGFREIYII